MTSFLMSQYLAYYAFVYCVVSSVCTDSDQRFCSAYCLWCLLAQIFLHFFFVYFVYDFTLSII